LCASEVLTNALTHAGGPGSVRVAWMRCGRVRVEVSDLSPKPPHVNKFAALDEVGQIEALKSIGGR
jgi:two-component sensor histidine kinase